MSIETKAPAVKLVGFESGQIAYQGTIEPTPATSTTSGNVTVTNTAQPGRPAHYDVSFTIHFETGDSPLQAATIFSVHLRLPGFGRDAPYGQVESLAARQVAPVLRAVADQIEQQVAEFDAKLPEIDL